MTEPTKKRPSGFRIPPVSAFILGLAIGYVVGNWMGALLGGGMGFILWRSRT